MKTLQTHEELLRRLSAAQKPLGRLQLTLHVLWRYWHSRWLLDGDRILKRFVDIMGSAAFLLLFSPVYAVLAALVKLEDRGPIFFSQTRVGQFGKEFKMYKFRSMCPNAEERLREVLAQNQHTEGVTFKIKDDPRLTRIGKWLRKFSLDELPQFFNVLKGDMSLVGPRPPVPREVALYTLADRRRLAVKPGITCIWQVSGRSEIDFSGQVRLDVQYIETSGLWMDLKLLFKTVPAVVSGKGAC
jgi:exopolysaccharide biosynthesis polyprenyl glycosylphosphotransferase